METWVSSSPQRKTQPKKQKQNFQNQRRWHGDYSMGREKSRTLEDRHCKTSV